MPLPAQATNAWRQRLADDARALCGPGQLNVVQAGYRRQGAAAAADMAVNLEISPRPAERSNPAMIGRGATGPQHQRQGFRVALAGLGPDETVAGGAIIGSKGGVVELRAGDLLTVPGYAAHQPTETAVILRVLGEIRLTGGLWTGEAGL